MRTKLAVLVLGVASLARADEHVPVPKDFAYGVTLTPQQTATLHAFTLPEHVLRGVSSSELRDLCVFDADGRERPSALRVASDVSLQVGEEALPMFPLETQATPQDEGVEVKVERDGEGNILRAFSKAVEARDNGVRALVDLTNISDPIVGLTLALSGPHDYTVRVQVDASDDLASFRPVTTATVAHLEHAGHTLRRDQVELPELHADYLRVTVTPARGTPAVSLDALGARVEHPGTELPRRFVELLPYEVTSDGAQVFRYRLDGGFEVDRYALALPSATTLAEATLLSSRPASGGANASYQILDRGLFRPADPARAIPRGNDHLFELRVSDKGGGVHGGAPGLRLGYLPPTLLFASDDRAPYTLAYGSASAHCERFSEAELRSGKTDLGDAGVSETVQASDQILLSGPEALPSPSQGSSRATWLWAVLLIGVGVLAFVTLRLARAMTTGK